MGWNSKSTSATNYQEAPQASGFRNSLYPQINQYLAQAQQPVYGNAQYAQQLNNLNGLANSSINQLSSTLAGRGGSLNSGAFGAGVTNILGQRAGQLANYNMQVPMLNRQAQQQATMGGLGLATNFAGRAPVNSTTTTSQQPGIGQMLGEAAGGFLGGGGVPGWQQLLGMGGGGQQQINQGMNTGMMNFGQQAYGPNGWMGNQGVFGSPQPGIDLGYGNPY